MSSEIFYDKAFIRMEEKYIPVVNHGSSNCFDFDSNKFHKRSVQKQIPLKKTLFFFCLIS